MRFVITYFAKIILNNSKCMQIASRELLLAIKNMRMAGKSNLLVKKSTSSFQMIKFLYAENLILSYSSYNINYVRVILNSSKYNNIFLTLKILSVASNKKYMQYYDLCRIILKHKFLVLSTSTQGYATSYQCKQSKIGGKLLFVL